MVLPAFGDRYSAADTNTDSLPPNPDWYTPSTSGILLRIRVRIRVRVSYIRLGLTLTPSLTLTLTLALTLTLTLNPVR